MLGRLGSGVALAATAVLVLVGCAPGEPSEEDTIVEARAAFDGFYQTIDEQMGSGQVAAEAFERYATPDLASQWARDIQATIDAGTTSNGVLILVDIELLAHSSDEVATNLCTDGRGIETVHADGSTQAPSTLVAWSATFLRSDDSDMLRLASLDPSQDQSICE